MSSAPASTDTAAGGAASSAKTTPATKSTTKKKQGTTKTTKKKTVTKSTAGTQAKAKKPVRKKKPAPKVSTTGTNQAVLQDARAAAADLAQQRANAAARKADPLWYRIEDVVPAVLEAEQDWMTSKFASAGGRKTSLPTVSTSSSSVAPTIQEQCIVLERALGHNGLTTSDLTPQAMACLLEYARRYTTELLQDATEYADMVSRSEITRADLMLAAEMRQDNPVTVNAQLPMLNALAQQINGRPLPPIPAHCYSGVLLPAPEHQLTSRTFDVISGAVTAMRTRSKYPAAPTAGASLTSDNNKKSGSEAKSSSQPSYGATRGRQIQVKLKEDTGGDANGGTSSTNKGKSD